jgi:hypothetical protein
MAWKKVMRSTRRESGQEAVKTGSKMVAAYRQSRGDVYVAAMMDPGPGSLDECCLDHVNVGWV